MQNLTSTLGRLAVVLTSALALSSCSRAEYAFLPKSASYLGTTTAASKARVATAPVATPAQEAQAPAAAPVAQAPAVAPEIVVATAPIAPRAAKVEAPTPQAQAEVAVAPEAAMVAAPAPQKLNLVQRMALAKVTKKLNKLATKSPQFKQGDNTAHTARVSGNLRIGLILLLIGLLLSIFGGAIGFIGFIIALIGVVFLVLWLLDEL
ncbi:hypothetical protein E4631_00885 [Hymenobacter sp. UV11]|uniref:hypothetical protein n=1 Tax=Hymenobacter sp. UV11 TaxID=1849735 RepID=UPI00105E9C33|nr:hypothetical protein [Hymenobacter sp. UV11]TDN37467.1 hypothetical protein A8B98_02715 [Hymenobacter sp. UV11]TFZ68654.1 hypothetical protein E4631_00885 [Hymenobacter sp. UV11]